MPKGIMMSSEPKLTGHLANATLQGMSAYEVAVKNGYTGTEDEWLASLKGETGETPNIQVGNVSTGQPGTNASATMTGTKENPVLNMTIPRGNVGATPNIAVGTVTTGEEGSQAQATITGTPEDPVLNLTIPRGNTGDAGFDPIVEVTKDGNTATVSVTDATHTTEVNIVDGYTPQKNVDYFDGHSPKITGAKSQGTTFIYSDGEQIGAVTDGEDGYTPRKGVDYFDGHTPAISGEKIDDTTFIYVDGVRIATVLDGLDGNSPVITTVKSGKTTSILADSVVVGTIDDGVDGHTPTITTTKSGKTTTILSDGTSIGTISDGQDGHSPEITTNKVGKVLTILSDGQTIGTVSDGLDGQDAVTPTITTNKSGTTTTIYSNGVAIGTVEDGADGSTPVITATKSEGITTIKANGIDIATINDGVAGDDGYSPTASVTKSGGVSTLTVTDENGTTTTQILDGTGMIASDPNNDGNIVLSSVVGVQIDEEPTSGSTNAISSGSVYNELTDLKSDLNHVLGKSTDALQCPIASEGFVQYTTGDIVSSALYSCTNYVDISNGDSISYKRCMTTADSATAGIAFYDANHTYISGEQCLTSQSERGYANDLRSVTIPDNAVYVRFSVFTDSTTYGTFAAFKEGYALPATIDALQDSIETLIDTKDNITDAYVTNDESAGLSWVYGTIDTSGDTYPGSPVNTARLTEEKYISYGAKVLILDSTVGAFLYAYDKTYNTYIGRYTESNVFSVSDGTAKFFHTEIDLADYSSEYHYRLVLKHNDGSTFNSTDDGLTIINIVPPADAKVYIKDVVSFYLDNMDGISREYAFIGSPEIYIPSSIEDSVIDTMQAQAIYAIYDDLVTNYPQWIKKESDIGYDSDGNAIRHYIIRMANPCYNAESYPRVDINNWDVKYDNKHILINAGTHGDEKTSVFGTAKFAETLITSTDKWAAFIKSNFVIHIVPILNVWGFNNKSRENKDNVNINRDFATLATTEANALVNLITSIGDNLKVIIDSHNTQSGIGMMGTKPSYKNHLYYVRTATTLAGIMTQFLSQYYASTQFPYFYAWESTSSQTLMDYINVNGYTGGTLETPRNYSAGETNHAETGAMVVGLLANLIQTYGTQI